MQYFIFNLRDGDRERAMAFLDAGSWIVHRDERHRDALAPGDLALIFAGLTREFVGRAEIKSTFLDPMPSDRSDPGPAVSGVLLGGIEEWTNAVPLNIAVQRIDPSGSNPNVQANAAGFPRGVMWITVREYDIVVSLHEEARNVAG